MRSLQGEDTNAGFGSGVQRLLLAQALLKEGWQAASITDGCRTNLLNRAIKLLKEAEVCLCFAVVCASLAPWLILLCFAQETCAEAKRIFQQTGSHMTLHYVRVLWLATEICQKKMKVQAHSASQLSELSARNVELLEQAEGILENELGGQRISWWPDASDAVLSQPCAVLY